MCIGKPIVEGDSAVRGGVGFLVGLLGRKIRITSQYSRGFRKARVGGGIPGVSVDRLLKESGRLLPAGIGELVHFVPALDIELVGCGIFRGMPFETLVLFSAEPESELVG